MRFVDQIIRWAGSKRRLVARLAQSWSAEHHRYVEPFCGSACLFFYLEPLEAILGDINKELVTTYKALARDADRVCAALRLLRKSRTRYYEIRSRRIDYRRPYEVAARFLYLNRYCFNGIYRTNASGSFNVPYGPQKQYSRLDYRGLKQKARLLGRATLRCQDFEDTLAATSAGDFVYLDPPYAVRNRRVFAEYQARPFSFKDLKRLAACLNDLNRKGATFMVSYADCREARQLLHRWNPTRVRVRRHIAGFASQRRIAYELLASNRPLTSLTKNVQLPRTARTNGKG